MTQALPSSMLAARLTGHPFLKGISNDLRQELLAHATPWGEPSVTGPSRLSLDQSPPPPDAGEAEDEERRERPAASYFPPEPKHRVLIHQGRPLPDEADGLLLSAMEDNTDLDVYFHGSLICKVTGPGLIGHEVMMGICDKALLEVHVRREPKTGMIFIPREALLSTLAQPKYAAEQQLLRERAEEAATEVMRNWFRRSPAKAKIRLFANSGHYFMAALMNAMVVRICKAGSTILKEAESTQSCICVYFGEAAARIGEIEVAQITSQQGVHAWACWWGILEVTRMCGNRPASVVAKTDCLVLELGADALLDLRAAHQDPCSLLDKVAVKHLQVLDAYTPNPMAAVPVLQGCPGGFLETLERTAVKRVLMPGEVVIQERDDGDEMFVLVRGCCSVHRGEASAAISTLAEGAYFGELAMLGISRKRTATVQCETVCDLRSISRNSLLQALSRFPDAGKYIDKMVEVRGHNRAVALLQLRSADIFKGFSDAFIQSLLDNMHEQPFLVGQTMIREGQEGYHMYVMISGEVEVNKCGLKVLSILAPTVLGELALLRPGLRSSATVRCRTFCDCLAVRGDLVSAQFLKNFPEDMGRMEAMLGTRMGNLTNIFPLKVDQVGPQPGRESDMKRLEEEQHEQNAFFRGSDPAFLERLSDRLAKWIYLDGQTMLSEGAEGRVALFIQEGTCTVDCGGRVIGQAGPGDVLGEVVVLQASPVYTATVKASGTVVAFAIDVKNMSDVLSHFPCEKARLQDIMKKRAGTNRQALEPSRPSKGLLNPRLGTPLHGADDGTGQASLHSPRRAMYRGRNTQVIPRLTMSTLRPGRQFRGAMSMSGRVAEEDAGGEAEEEQGECHLTQRSPRLDAFDWSRTERWLDQRREAMRSSAPVRQERLLRTGALVVPVPSAQGWRVTASGAGTAFAADAPHSTPRVPADRGGAVSRSPGKGGQQLSPPSQMRLRKTERVYGRPVWKEVFGIPAEPE